MTKSNLSRVIGTWRWSERKGLREAAKEIGLTHSTMQRLEVGKEISAENLQIVLAWLFAKTDEIVPRRKEKSK